MARRGHHAHARIALVGTATGGPLVDRAIALSGFAFTSDVTPGDHLSATDPRGLLTPPLPFGLFILIELTEWIFLNG